MQLHCEDSVFPEGWDIWNTKNKWLVKQARTPLHWTNHHHSEKVAKFWRQTKHTHLWLLVLRHYFRKTRCLKWKVVFACTQTSSFKWDSLWSCIATFGCSRQETYQAPWPQLYNSTITAIHSKMKPFLQTTLNRKGMHKVDVRIICQLTFHWDGCPYRLVPRLSCMDGEQKSLVHTVIACLVPQDF